MPISLVSTAENQDAAGGTVTLTLSNTAIGDVVYVFSSGQVAASSPTGYTEVATVACVGAFAGVFSRCSRKVLTAADSSVEMPASGAGTLGQACLAFVLRGVSSTTPEDVSATTDSAEDTDILNPPITTITNNSWILLFAGMPDLQEAGHSQPAGYSNLIDEQSDSTAFDATAFGCTRNLPTAGTETPGIWGGDAGDWWAITVAVREELSGTFTEGTSIVHASIRRNLKVIGY